VFFKSTHNVIIAMVLSAGCAVSAWGKSPKECARAAGSLVNKDFSELWNHSAQQLRELRKEVLEMDDGIHAIGTILMANDFAMLSGPPGGGKSFAAAKMLESEIRGLDDKTKKNFYLQMHQLIAAGYFTGFPNIERLEKGDGKWELNLESSLIADKFILFLIEEIDKAHPANLQTLLSLLNERKAFLGAEPVDLLLRAGLFTTNNTIETLLASYKKDRPSGQALLDRMGVKAWIKNKMLHAENVKRLKHKDVPGAGLPHNPDLQLHLTSLKPLLNRVTIPSSVIVDAAHLIFDLDVEEQKRIEEARTNFKDQESGMHDGSEDEDLVTDHAPVNQFSNRSNRTLVLNTLKASFLMRQLEEGVPYQDIKYTIEKEDLEHLQTGALLQGEGKVRPKVLAQAVKLRSEGNSGVPTFETQALWDPYTSRLRWKDASGKIHTASYDRQTKAWSGESLASIGAYLGDDVEKGGRKYFALPQAEGVFAKLIEKYESDNPELLAQRHFEEDGTVDALFANIPHLTPDDRTVLKRMKKERSFFADRLKKTLERETNNERASKVDALEKVAAERIERIKERNAEIRTLKNSLVPGDWNTPAQRRAREELTRLSYANLVDAYPGSEYAIRSILEAAIAKQHVHLFGPPGGAKTAIARAVLGGLVDGLKYEGVDNYLWMQQFHKMVPEGQIIGSDNMQATKAGKVKVDKEGTLIDPKVHYGIGDEMERAHPGVTTAGLTVLNERRVPRGDSADPVNLETFVMTTNMMPSEWLEAFGPGGEKSAQATFDRVARKVYVSNKFDTPEELATFLIQTERSEGLVPEVFFPGEALKAWKDAGVRKESDSLFSVAYKATKLFIQENIERQRTQRLQHKSDDKTYPFWYLAPSDGSIRTESVNGAVWQSSVFLRHLLNPESESPPRSEFTFRDLGSVADTFRHQYSGSLEPYYEGADGLLQFRVKSPPRTALNLEERDRYLRDEMDRELERWQKHLNQAIKDAFMAQRELVAQFPSLFPELVRIKKPDGDGK
jgi:MoxR-like ATPase